jgi:XTP/dITP diphosphohydrolase
MKLIVATNNRHKLSEIGEILLHLNCNNIELLCAEDFSKSIRPDEIGFSYHENAEIKANAFFKEFALPTIADDSGLEIDFLNGLPGISSSSFGGEEGNHKKNRQKLLSIMKEANISEAKARFRCVICYIDDEEKFFVEGIVEGKIINTELGNNGFGYDPMFIPDGYKKTFAEMDDFEKNQISHRANAIRNLINTLREKNKI